MFVYVQMNSEQMYRMMLCYLKKTGACRPKEHTIIGPIDTIMFLLLFSLLGRGSCVPFLGFGSSSPFGSSQDDPPAPVACVVHGTCYQGGWVGFQILIVYNSTFFCNSHIFQMRIFTVHVCCNKSKFNFQWIQSFNEWWNH